MLLYKTMMCSCSESHVSPWPHVPQSGVTESPERGNQHDQGHGKAALQEEISSEPKRFSSHQWKNISHFFDQKLVPVAASLGRGNITATGTLSEEEGANFVSSTSSSYATEGGCLGDARLERHGEGLGCTPMIGVQVRSSAGSTFLFAWLVSLSLLLCCAHHPGRAQRVRDLLLNHSRGL